jgi:hypothetical protein
MIHNFTLVWFGLILFGQDKKRKKPHFMHVFICIPVAPGRSRVITAFPRNFGLWLDNIIPRWFHHIGQNAILDSDTYILHIEVNDDSSPHPLGF